MSVDDLLNIGARLLLRVCSPLQAHALLMRIGRALPQRHTRAEVRVAASRLGPKGTCLSRALALAARSPSADVVIGVRPEGDRSVFAHAWVEMDGEPLDSTHPAGSEIARMHGRPRQ
jgi:hypothetical protein